MKAEELKQKIKDIEADSESYTDMINELYELMQQYADEVSLKFAQHLNHKKSNIYDFVKYFNTWKSNQEEQP